ncbi:MAG: hypothetical protein AAGB00_13440 [Planctomycetota bacterium]
MLRYTANPSRRPRNYLLRREQTRLLLLVGSLGVVLIAMQQVRGPRAMAVLEATFGVPPTASDAQPGARDATASDATRLESAWFEAVRDNTFFRNAEQGAWFKTLGVLKRDGAPEPASAVTYAQLVTQPDAYRGRAVAVRGWARRVEQVEPAANDAGIETLYRVTVQPAGGEVWPVTVYCLGEPDVAGRLEAAPPGDELRAPMQANGYFFKNASYRWRDGLGTTPVILAAGVTIAPPPAATRVTTQRDFDPLTVLVAALLVSGVLVGVIVLKNRAADPRPRRRSGTIVIEMGDADGVAVARDRGAAVKEDGGDEAGDAP